MKKFTLFNNKWHPIRFIFWIFSTKTGGQAMKIAFSFGRMKAKWRFLRKK
jgi:hypothetical protein